MAPSATAFDLWVDRRSESGVLFRKAEGIGRRRAWVKGIGGGKGAKRTFGREVVVYKQAAIVPQSFDAAVRGSVSGGVSECLVEL